MMGVRDLFTYGLMALSIAGCDNRRLDTIAKITSMHTMEINTTKLEDGKLENYHAVFYDFGKDERVDVYVSIAYVNECYVSSNWKSRYGMINPFRSYCDEKEYVLMTPELEEKVNKEYKGMLGSIGDSLDESKFRGQ